MYWEHDQHVMQALWENLYRRVRLSPGADMGRTLEGWQYMGGAKPGEAQFRHRGDGPAMWKRTVVTLRYESTVRQTV